MSQRFADVPVSGLGICARASRQTQVRVLRRHQLRQAAAQIDLLEDRLEQMSRTCNAVVNTGKTFVQDFQ